MTLAGKPSDMADTKAELRWKSQGAFALAGLSTVGAVYLSFTSLPPTKVAHGRIWIVGVALTIAMLCCAVGVLDRHLIAKAPEGRPLPSVDQVRGGVVLTACQAMAMLVVGVAQLRQGDVGIGCMALAACVAFLIVIILMKRQPTRA
jgi:uncharacterized membrane protein